MTDLETNEIDLTRPAVDSLIVGIELGAERVRGVLVTISASPDAPDSSDDSNGSDAPECSDGVDRADEADQAIVVAVAGAVEVQVMTPVSFRPADPFEPSVIGAALEDVLSDLGVNRDNPPPIALSFGPPNSGVGSGPALPGWLEQQAQVMSQTLMCAGDLGVAFVPDSALQTVLAAAAEANLTPSRVDFAPVAATRVLDMEAIDTITLGSGRGWQARLRDAEVLEALEVVTIERDAPLTVVGPENKAEPVEAYHEVELAEDLAAVEPDLAQYAASTGAALGFHRNSPGNLLDGVAVVPGAGRPVLDDPSQVELSTQQATPFDAHAARTTLNLGHLQALAAARSTADVQIESAPEIIIDLDDEAAGEEVEATTVTEAVADAVEAVQDPGPDTEPDPADEADKADEAIEDAHAEDTETTAPEAEDSGVADAKVTDAEAEAVDGEETEGEDSDADADDDATEPEADAATEGEAEAEATDEPEADATVEAEAEATEEPEAEADTTEEPEAEADATEVPESETAEADATEVPESETAEADAAEVPESETAEAELPDAEADEDVESVDAEAETPEVEADEDAPADAESPDVEASEATAEQEEAEAAEEETPTVGEGEEASEEGLGILSMDEAPVDAPDRSSQRRALATIATVAVLVALLLYFLVLPNL